MSEMERYGAVGPVDMNLFVRGISRVEFYAGLGNSVTIKVGEVFPYFCLTLFFETQEMREEFLQRFADQVERERTIQPIRDNENKEIAK